VLIAMIPAIAAERRWPSVGALRRLACYLYLTGWLPWGYLAGFPWYTF